MLVGDITLFLQRILFIIGIVGIQLYLVRRTQKGIGLALPAISFGISIIRVIQFIMVSTENSPEWMLGMLLFVFIFFNLETVLLMIVYWTRTSRIFTSVITVVVAYVLCNLLYAVLFYIYALTASTLAAYF